MLLGWRSWIIHIRDIRADARGLTRGSGPNAMLISWENMSEVIWKPHGPGGYPSYAMLTDNPLEAITWPTAPPYLDTSVSPDGAVHIDPDKLATLVAAKIGRPIRVIV